MFLSGNLTGQTFLTLIQTRLGVDRVKPWNWVRINLGMGLSGMILDQVLTIQMRRNNLALLDFGLGFWTGHDDHISVLTNDKKINLANDARGCKCYRQSLICSLQTMTKYANTSSPVLLSLPQPPVYLYTMMGIWASITGIMGITANTLAIGVFIKVKRVRRL